MTGTASSGNTGQDAREFASGKVLTVLGTPAGGGDTLGFWIEAYLTAAVRGVRSPEVAGKIARHVAGSGTGPWRGSGTIGSRR